MFVRSSEKIVFTKVKTGASKNTLNRVNVPIARVISPSQALESPVATDLIKFFFFLPI